MQTDDGPSSAAGPTRAQPKKKLKLPEAADAGTDKNAIYKEVLEALSPHSDMTEWPKTDPEWASSLASAPGVTFPQIQALLKANGLSTSAKTTKQEKICQILEHLRS